MSMLNAFTMLLALKDGVYNVAKLPSHKVRIYL